MREAGLQCLYEVGAELYAETRIGTGLYGFAISIAIEQAQVQANAEEAAIGKEVAHVATGFHIHRDTLFLGRIEAQRGIEERYRIVALMQVEVYILPGAELVECIDGAVISSLPV